MLAPVDTREKTGVESERRHALHAQCRGIMNGGSTRVPSFARHAFAEPEELNINAVRSQL